LLQAPVSCLCALLYAPDSPSISAVADTNTGALFIIKIERCRLNVPTDSSTIQNAMGDVDIPTEPVSELLVGFLEALSLFD